VLFVWRWLSCRILKAKENENVKMDMTRAGRQEIARACLPPSTSVLSRHEIPNRINKSPCLS
jgi:hypothetical protein